MAKCLKISNQITQFEKLGGRDSVFGLLRIFSIAMEESHANITEEELKANWPFRSFTCFEAYGNLVERKYTEIAIKQCIEEYNFTKEEWILLSHWFISRGSPDVVVTTIFISEIVFGHCKHLFELYAIENPDSKIAKNLEKAKLKKEKDVDNG